MDNRKYFSVRININSYISEEDIIDFMSCYKHVLVCREEADKDVKNTHTHCLIWGDGMPEDRDLFERLLKGRLSGCKGNGRFAICDTSKPFYNAVKYVCKGYKNTEPIIIVNSDFTEAEILQAWADYWEQNIKLEKKAQEDTSQRLPVKLWENYSHLIPWDANSRYEIFNFWYKTLLDEYEKDMKPYNTVRFGEIMNTLMLRTDRLSFEAIEKQKIAKICGFSNAAVEYAEQK